MITCDKCGTQTSEDQHTCPGCGAGLNINSASETSSEAQWPGEETTTVNAGASSASVESNDAGTEAVASPVSSGSAASDGEPTSASSHRATAAGAAPARGLSSLTKAL
ncbi:MAG TPA: hypothetical protein VGA87_07425, partial [Pyrinomonadaceae bacterium]